MKAITHANQAALLALSAKIDAALGYPIAGVDVGGGVHAPPAQSITTAYSYVFKHPTLAVYSYFVDPTNTPKIAQAIAALPAVADLTSDWFSVGP